MTALTPEPSSLGLAAPTLGPWFSTDVTLPAPAADLGVAVTIPAGTDWLPPAGGLLSLLVATDPLPPVLAGLRGPAGTAPFTTGALVATFRLLPEVEARLGALLSDVPPADASAAATVPTRARLRTLALALPENPATLATVLALIRPEVDDAVADKAGHLGLVETAGLLGNARVPISDLKRPGTFAGSREVLLHVDAATDATLYAFDHRGRAIDPGAVAAWWARLAGSFTNLWANGVSQRTATADAGLRIHLVGADEGPVAEAVLTRLADQNLTGAGPVRTRGAGSGAATVALTAGAEDDAPLPRVALLPAGAYADTVDLWPSGAVGGLTRDFVRIGIVDVERHLLGQARVAAAEAGDAASGRAADQARASTRALVARATTTATDTVLLATADQALGALADVLAAGPAQLVAPVLDRAAGELTVPAGPDIDPPDALPGTAVTVTPLIGGGSADGGTVTGQRVLVEVALEPSRAGSWVRVWPQYFDADTGRHLRGAGGGGRVDPAGSARAVVRLADGAVEPGNSLGLDLQVVTARGATRYPEVRLERPGPVGGALVDLAAVTGTVLACEPGLEFGAGAVPSGGLAAGSSLVALGVPPALVDPASVPATAWADGTVGPALDGADRVLLTEPAWNGWRGGEDAAALAATGADVSEVSRSGLARLTGVGAPLPTQSRDEVAAVVLSDTVADGAVAAVRPLGAHHEVPTHQTGHPGAPADDERHGGGARLRGPAAVGLAEILRERLAGSTPELAVAAGDPLPVPDPPTVPGSWAATLRTVGFGVEAEPFLIEALNALGTDGYPWNAALDQIRTWLSGLGVPLPAVVGDPADSIVRAVNRRLLGARSGYREAATALADRLSGAQDFVYVETPALDALTTGEGDDALTVWSALVDRVAANPVLQVLLCLPRHLVPGTPTSLHRVRDHDALAAVGALRAVAGDRLALFDPTTGPGRSLHLDVTNVVVDDAWAMTGGTHLWRRGLSFDASLAVVVFDERLSDGRPAEVVAFRRALIAGRLGLSPGLVPDDPAELVRAVRQLSDRGGGVRLSPEPIVEPEFATSELDERVWNPDGAPTSGFDPLAWLAGLGAAVEAELAAEVPGSV